MRSFLDGEESYTMTWIRDMTGEFRFTDIDKCNNEWYQEWLDSLSFTSQFEDSSKVGVKILKDEFKTDYGYE
jgi:hypothetical protein